MGERKGEEEGGRGRGREVTRGSGQAWGFREEGTSKGRGELGASGKPHSPCPGSAQAQAASQRSGRASSVSTPAAAVPWAGSRAPRAPKWSRVPCGHLLRAPPQLASAHRPRGEGGGAGGPVHKGHSGPPEAPGTMDLPGALSRTWLSLTCPQF